MEKDEIVRGESAHKQRKAVKKEQVQRKKQDTLEALRTQQEKEVRGCGFRQKGEECFAMFAPAKSACPPSKL